MLDSLLRAAFEVFSPIASRMVDIFWREEK
jgi:hypothetical protein